MNQVGDLDDFEGGEIRVLRFGVVGSLNFKRPWRYTISAGTNTFDKGFDVDTTDDLSFTTTGSMFLCLPTLP